MDQKSTTVPRGPKVAIVYAEGTIVDGEGGGTNIGGDKLAQSDPKVQIGSRC